MRVTIRVVPKVLTPKIPPAPPNESQKKQRDLMPKVVTNRKPYEDIFGEIHWGVWGVNSSGLLAHPCLRKTRQITRGGFCRRRFSKKKIEKRKTGPRTTHGQRYKDYKDQNENTKSTHCGKETGTEYEKDRPIDENMKNTHCGKDIGTEHENDRRVKENMNRTHCGKETGTERENERPIEQKHARKETDTLWKRHANRT